jgi:uncharacterized damage-inducible protein DinB
MGDMTKVPLGRQAADELATAGERFNRSTSQLTESLSTFSPAPGMMTAAQQFAHTARVMDWFLEGAFRPEGFDMNFEAQIKTVLAVESLAQARAWLDRSMSTAIDFLAGQTDGQIMESIVDGPVMGGLPRMAIVSALIDHIAHHRGALTVYARLNGIEPADPYGM